MVPNKNIKFVIHKAAQFFKELVMPRIVLCKPTAIMGTGDVFRRTYTGLPESTTARWRVAVSVGGGIEGIGGRATG